MEDVCKEVNFEKYCKTCEHCALDGKFDPCNDCLAECVNTNSEKPVYWKEEE